MDNNTNKQTNTTTQGGLTPNTIATQPQPVSSVPSASNGKMSKIIVIVSAAVVALIVIGGGAYFYLKTQNYPSDSSYPQTPQNAANPTFENAEKDLNSIELGDVDSEFTSVDKDLQSL